MPPKFKRNIDGGASAPERQALLDGTSDDEDFFLQGPRVNTGRLGGNDRISRLKGQVHEVVDVMQDNISKVMERGDRLEDLQDKSENLSSSADMFKSRASTLRRQMWWKECRMRILLGVVVVIILTVIIVPIIVHNKNG